MIQNPSQCNRSQIIFTGEYSFQFLNGIQTCFVGNTGKGFTLIEGGAVPVEVSVVFRSKLC